jgi:hypothetical protein
MGAIGPYRSFLMSPEGRSEQELMVYSPLRAIWERSGPERGDWSKEWSICVTIYDLNDHWYHCYGTLLTSVGRPRGTTPTSAPAGP